MASAVSTITSKWQVTLPEEARKDIAVKAGQRLLWVPKAGYWEVRPLPALSELSGCLKTDQPPLTDKALRDLLRDARARTIGRSLARR